MTRPDAPYAKPPRLRSLDSEQSGIPFEGEVEVVDGWVELSDVVLDGRVLAFPDVGVVELSRVTMRSCRLIVGRNAVVRLRNTSLTNCDISQVPFKTVTNCRFVDCKMTGTSFLGEMSDIELRSCRLQLGSLAMTKIARVAFNDCELGDVDLLESKLSDVAFDGSQLRAVNVHRTTFDRVDFRGASPIELVSVNSLAGCLIAYDQIYEMAPMLAAIVGLQIETPPHHLEQGQR